MGQLTPILKADDVQTQQQLEERRCMATLGTGGTGFEKVSRQCAWHCPATVQTQVSSVGAASMIAGSDGPREDL